MVDERLPVGRAQPAEADDGLRTLAELTLTLTLTLTPNPNPTLTLTLPLPLP